MNDASRSQALLADDHELFRAGAAEMLQRECGYTTVFQAGSLAEAVGLLETHPAISLACFDLGMPGIDNPLSLKAIRERFPDLALVVMTASETRDNILLALQSGVNGYVPKTLPIGEIIRAFGIVANGGIYVPQQIAKLPTPFEPETGARDARRLTGSALDRNVEIDLTKRQEEILRLIQSGKSNKEIGFRLGLSENTVKVHANALFKKLQVRSRYEAAAVWRGTASAPGAEDGDTKAGPQQSEP